MRRDLPTVRGRAGRCGRRVAGVLVAGLALLALTAAPAAASQSPKPTVDCIVPGNGGTYQAVFGYDNHAKNTVTVPVGPYNAMSPASLNGIQPTQFAPGANRAAFATPPVAGSSPVSWTLVGITVTATSQTATCGPSVSLPAEGNGIGPVLVLAGSVVLSIGALYVRQWRQRRVRA